MSPPSAQRGTRANICHASLYLYWISTSAQDLDVTITGVSGQTFSFDTGLGIGGTNNVEIYVFDKCRTEDGTRVPVGMFYPSSTVTGINVDALGVVNSPGAGNTIAFDFVEGIAQNTDIYSYNGDDTATLEFCAQVGVSFR